MRIGFAQFAPTLANRDATIESIEGLAPSFEPADLIVLPELCNSGYNFASKEQAWESSEEVSRSVFVAYLVDLCNRHSLHIVSGLNERAGDALYNSSLLVGPAGVVGVYRKLHLFLNEKDFFAPGNVGLPVFQFGGVRIGMLICFDWRFPEAWRILALKGADIICHASNLVIPGNAQSAVPVHALINRVFIVTANRVGTEGDLRFTGRSIIADPHGRVLAEAPEAEESVAVVEIDPAQARNKQITSRNHLVDDRRTDVYASLLDTGASEERAG